MKEAAPDQRKKRLPNVGRIKHVRAMKKKQLFQRMQLLPSVLRSSATGCQEKKGSRDERLSG
jgi:hypothetical protein